MPEINHIQIQTLNLCNLKCTMCPHKNVFSKKTKMDDDLFIKVIDEIVEGIRKGLIGESLYFSPFFQNEPFLDDTIFDKVEYIREKLPRAFIEIFTNGTFFDVYKDKICSMNISQLKFSLYGYNVSSFNNLTKSSFNNESYNIMIKSFHYIKNNADFNVINDSPFNNKTLRGFSSRGGFFTNNKIIHNKISGCRWKRDEWLNILADGTIPICCMDWRKEVILGDLNKQSLSKIILSKKRQIIVDKINGLESEKDFICKRCEKALGDGGGDKYLLDFNP